MREAVIRFQVVLSATFRIKLEACLDGRIELSHLTLKSSFIPTLVSMASKMHKAHAYLSILWTESYEISSCVIKTG